MFAKGFWHTGRTIRNGEVAVVGLRARDALLHIADGVQILAELRAIVHAQPLPEPRNFLRDAVQNAAIFLAPGEARFGGIAVAEHPLENKARVRLRWER